jgi:hypothetical protein
MNSLKKIANWSGGLVFSIAFLVYFFSVERTGSLWDCGEFILGAYKLQVVHPPGAPIFLIIGRIFAALGDLISDDPSVIAWMVNLSSALFTALSAMFVAWVTVIMGNISLNGRENNPQSTGEAIALTAAGVAAGLSTAFAISIWFSAVEGEVYALSLFFTTLTLWSAVKWYNLPEEKQSDRWLVFTFFSIALSIGVHLLSLLVLPALGILYYFKKYKQHTTRGILIAAAAGTFLIGAIQVFVITGIPQIWALFEVFMVNNLGMPFHSGLIPTFLIVAGIIYYSLKKAHQSGNHLLQIAAVSLMLTSIAYTTYGVTLIRANVNPPINMNNPNDALRLLPYLKREQYGDRPLLKGIDFDKDQKSTETKERMGRVGDKYEVVDYAYKAVYDEKDMRLFPRMPHNSGRYPNMYREWLNLEPGESPTAAHNLQFFIRYQVNWMYLRYLMWNFAGRTNAVQGIFDWDLSRGQWMSGIPFIDNARLYDMSKEPDALKNNEGRNTYYLLPFLFGLIGLIFHFKKNPKEAFAIFVFFFISGLGLIIYSNQPPAEPRERDYVFAGSFFTYAIWIGFGLLALYQFLSTKISKVPAAAVASCLVLLAPAIMAFQNFDDMSRYHHTGARDLAYNFLESLEPNAIIFTYGDNDTYPLWYAQEVENIRTDVRVVNLSLIAVDWYIDNLRRKINQSEKLKFSIPEEALRGYKRNQLFVYNPSGDTSNPMPLNAALKFIGEDHPLPLQSGKSLESYLLSKNLFLPLDPVRARNAGLAKEGEELQPALPIKINRDYIMKDDIAILDIILSNLYERPIYFATTVVSEKLYGLQEFLQLEGMAIRLTGVRKPTVSQLGNFGVGNVDLDKNLFLYQNVFKLGGWDNRKMFVDDSYGAGHQSQRMSMLRTGLEALKAERFDIAIAVSDEYFRAFPDNNFPYDGTAMNMINNYVEAGEYDKAKLHMRILVNQVQQHLDFFNHLGERVAQQGFSRQRNEYQRILGACIAMSREMEDDAFEIEIINALGYLMDTSE